MAPEASPPVSSQAAFKKIVDTLMCYRVTGTDDKPFVEQAIKSLVTKLKKRVDELDSLIIGVTTLGKVDSGCVTVERTLDGRIQVASRKEWPHLVYARIWRWCVVEKEYMNPIRTCK